MEALNICYLSYEYPLWGTGGIGSFIQTIARALVRAGHRVSVVGIGKGPQEEHFQDRGVDIYRLPAPRLFKKAGFAENAWRIRRKLREMHESRPLDVVEAPEALMLCCPPKPLTSRWYVCMGAITFLPNRNSGPSTPGRAFWSADPTPGPMPLLRSRNM